MSRKSTAAPERQRDDDAVRTSVTQQIRPGIARRVADLDDDDRARLHRMPSFQSTKRLVELGMVDRDERTGLYRLTFEGVIVRDALRGRGDAMQALAFAIRRDRRNGHVLQPRIWRGSVQ